MKKAVLVILMVLMVIGGIFAEGQKDDGKITIGYTFHSAQDVFQNQLKEEFVKAAEAKGWEVKVIDPLLDIEKQVAAVETFISLGVDAIGISPLDSQGCIPAVKMANDAGIPIVSVNARIDPSAGEFVYVGSDNYDAGKMEGEYIASILPQGANVIYLQGTPGMDHSIKRRQAIMDTVIDARPDVTLLADQTANYDRAEGMMVMEDLIQAFPQFGEGDALITANDQMSLGGLEALKGAGISGVIIGGIDGTDEAKQNVKNGTFAITVLQDKAGQAQTSIDTIEKILNGETVDGDVMVPFVPITKENIDEFM